MVVFVSGEVDMATAPLLVDALKAAFARDGDSPVVVDVAGVSFIDSSGLNALAQAYKASRSDRAKRVSIRSPRPKIREVLELTGLDRVLEIE